MVADIESKSELVEERDDSSLLVLNRNFTVFIIAVSLLLVSSLYYVSLDNNPHREHTSATIYKEEAKEAPIAMHITRISHSKSSHSSNHSNPENATAEVPGHYPGTLRKRSNTRLTSRPTRPTRRPTYKPSHPPTAIPSNYLFPDDALERNSPLVTVQDHIQWLSTEIPIINEPIDRNLRSLHMTRYYGGQLPHLNPLSAKPENLIIPWIRCFNTIVSKCNINWGDPAKPPSRQSSSCVYQFSNQDPNIPTWVSMSPYERVHVHRDRQHIEHFLFSMAPFYAQAYTETGKQIILHFGGGDALISKHLIQQALNLTFVKRLLIEENTVESVAHHTKLFQMPIGIAPAFSYQEHGDELMLITRESRGDHFEHPNDHWGQRRDRVLFCFNSVYQERSEALEFAAKCDVCDVCNHSMPQRDLWRAYGEYKFVFSPFGNGVECGRTWEILVVGAIAIVPYTPSAQMYSQHNMSVVSVRQLSEINATSLALWSSRYRNGTSLVKLSAAYWQKEAFLNI